MHTVPLPEHTFKFGYALKLINRTAKHAFFECYQHSNLHGYIVCKIRILPAWKGYPKREAIPSKSRGGSEVWFYMKESKKMALEHYQEFEQ